MIIDKTAENLEAAVEAPDEAAIHRQGRDHRGPEARERRRLRQKYRDQKAAVEPEPFPSFKVWARKHGTRSA
jgi:hypothetical protein